MSPIYQSVPARQAIGWRLIESAAIDILRQGGATFRDRAGVTWLVVEIINEETGQLADVRYILDIEDFARALADEMSARVSVTVPESTTIFDGFQNAIRKDQKFRREPESPSGNDPGK